MKLQFLEQFCFKVLNKIRLSTCSMIFIKVNRNNLTMNICIIHIKYTYAHASTEYHIILIKVNIKFGQLGCKNKNKTADMFKKKLKK